MTIFRPTVTGDYAPLRDDIIQAVLESPAGMFGYDEESVQALFAGDGITCEVDGTPVGVALYSLQPSAFNQSETVGLIYLWTVSREQQGRGIGSSILHAVELACAKSGAAGIIHMPAVGRAAEIAEQAGYHPYKLAMIKHLEACRGHHI